MPSFYFDVCDYLGYCRDDNGLELHKPGDVQQVAMYLLDAIAVSAEPSPMQRKVTILVRDDGGATVYQIDGVLCAYEQELEIAMLEPRSKLLKDR